MNTDEKDVYFVAVKLFVEHENKLLILKDVSGRWDLPGGQLRKDEFEKSFNDILTHKIHDELGPDIELSVGKPVVFMRHEEPEPLENGEAARIFSLGYPASVVRGTPVLSPRYAEMTWVDPLSFDPEHYFTNGWLDGVREYLRVRG